MRAGELKTAAHGIEGVAGVEAGSGSKGDLDLMTWS